MPGEGVLRKCTCTDNKIKCLILPSTYVFIAIIAIAVVRLHILLVIEMFVMLTDDEYDGSDHCLLFIRHRRIVLHGEDKPPQDAGHILSRIYNSTKAGNQRAKRGESEGRVWGKAPECENFLDIRTRPLGVSINHFL